MELQIAWGRTITLQTGVLLVSTVCALAVAGCGEKKAETTTDVAAADAMAPAADAMAAPAPPEEAFSLYPDGDKINIRNDSPQTAHVKRVIMNGIEDGDCRVNPNKDVESKGFIEVGPFECGEINTVVIETENGKKSYDWTTLPKLKARVFADDQDEDHIIEITNSGLKPELIKVIYVNGRDSDKDCNMKVFKEIAAESSETYGMHSCGKIMRVKIDSATGQSNFTFGDPAKLAEADDTNK